MTPAIATAFEAYKLAEASLQAARSQLQAAVTLFFRFELTQAELLAYSIKADAAESARDMAMRTFRATHQSPEVA